MRVIQYRGVPWVRADMFRCFLSRRGGLRGNGDRITVVFAKEPAKYFRPFVDVKIVSVYALPIIYNVYVFEWEPNVSVRETGC